MNYLFYLLQLYAQAIRIYCITAFFNFFVLIVSLGNLIIGHLFCTYDFNCVNTSNVTF